MPYLSIVIARASHRDNASVGVRDVHLPDNWLLNARRGCRFLRRRATGGKGAMRYAMADLSYYRTCDRTRRSPWTPRGGIDQRMTLPEVLLGPPRK
jgi:hypothetical protein